MQRGLLNNSGHPEPVGRHLLVTNDYPPKLGGIQNYLWELWRRLPADETHVYCTPYAGAASFDARQPHWIERSPEPVLIPYPWLPRRISALAARLDAPLVLLDPAVPLGLIGPHLDRPYGVILHGAEVTIPARIPGSRALLRRVLAGASLVISAGEYALGEAERCVGRSLPSVVVPPGVDTERFRPFSPSERAAARAEFDLTDEHVVVSSVNRLVPRKGMHLLIEAAARLASSHPELRVMIGGTGRAESDLRAQADELGAPVRFLGRISDGEVERLYGASDAMAMLCHDRWWGLEQEGFGIVFLEAAAAGLPQIAGRSGGAAEAVVHGETGLVVDDPTDVAAVTASLRTVIDDPDLRRRLGRAARERAVARFDYDVLARRLAEALDHPTGADQTRSA